MGILAFTDKLIGQETAGRISRVIEMTQVAQIEALREELMNDEKKEQ